MRSRLAIFILLYSSMAYAQSSSPIIWAFGLGGSAGYQQPRYVDTDFSGIDNFSYQSKLQWLGAVNVRMYPDDRFCIQFSTGMRDAGWRKVNDDPSLEPHWLRTDYSFLYTFMDVSIGTGFGRKNPLLHPTFGFTQQFAISSREKTYYEDGHTESSEARLVPNKYPNSIYIAFNYTWNVGAHSDIGFQYRCEVGIKKYHDVIVRSPQIQHSVGVNYHFSL